MTDAVTAVVTLAELPLEPFAEGERFACADAGLSERLGLSQLGAAYCEVPPGKSACPFHVHHVEDELFIILSGSGRYRFGEQSFDVKAGDVLGAPHGGADYAHQLINTGSEPLKYMAISSRSETEVCEYPDSGKFLVASRRSLGRLNSFRFIGRQESNCDYWDGETTPK
ncbi:cupin domain-containing protein [Halioxenophilus sp. WMMB6]|uniref:cupin domain-containing protein n=1 Tax=Halioxenophilus sp. WMMB6 TaxID=3073815 RepID=UPI00295E7FCB|nr:cupin domain-containing protein [Halioxenophilus sp. WMMB6]